MMSDILRDAGPEYLAGLLVLATGAVAGALMRTVRRHRAAARRQAAQARPEENL
jgi:hypothetical protein